MDIKTLESFKLSDAIKFHDTLNPKLWRNQHLRPEVKDQLILIAQDFLQELGISDLDVKDITVSGSNAAYSYTDHSDLDLHILVDMGNLPDDEVYNELFNAKKTLYNDNHDIKIHGVPVELYVQDAREPVVSLGEYSILNNKWLRLPTKRRANFDQTATKSKYEKLLHLIQLALKSNDLKKVLNILKTIKQYRQAGLDLGGEFGPENLAYKALRSQGYITKMYELRDKLHNERLTIETMYNSITDEDYSPDNPPGPEFKPTMPAGTVKVDVSDVYDWYKLGQHISNLKGLGKHDFGSGPPSTILAFGDEDTEHQYIDALKKTGLTTTDIDPVDPKQPKGMKRQKTDPTYNVSEDTKTTEHYNGIEISLEKEDDEIMITAMMPSGRELGHVLFVQEGDYLMPQDLEVDERYQGQGIAATMYDYVKSKGYKIRRSGQQTDAGAGFWDKHRPEQNVWEAGTMQYAAEKTPATNPYGGLRDRQYRGSISEIRKNPEQNRKSGSGKYDLINYAEDNITDKDNWAVSMTMEPKLGVNPRAAVSEDTPKGIYFYPLRYFMKMADRDESLPWGDNFPYMQLFQYDRSGEMTQQTKVDPARLKQALLQYCPEEVIQQASEEGEYDGTPYWFIYDCLSRLGENDETNVVRWNKVLRDLGFTSVYDPGNGWIAYNEPTQGVVLDPRIIKQNKMFVNRNPTLQSRRYDIQGLADAIGWSSYYQRESQLQRVQINHPDEKKVMLVRHGVRKFPRVQPVADAVQVPTAHHAGDSQENLRRVQIQGGRPKHTEHVVRRRRRLHHQGHGHAATGHGHVLDGREGGGAARHDQGR